MVGVSRTSAVQPVAWWVESHQPFIQFFIFHRFWRGKWASRRLCQWDIGSRHNSGSWGCVTLLKVFSPSQFKSLTILSWLLHQPANVGIRITWSSLKDSRTASCVRRKKMHYRNIDIIDRNMHSNERLWWTELASAPTYLLEWSAVSTALGRRDLGRFIFPIRCVTLERVSEKESTLVSDQPGFETRTAYLQER